MNNFIESHLITLKNNNFLNPEIELRTLLNFSSIKKQNIFFCNFETSQIDLDKFNSFFKRRICQEPLSKIVNNKEFDIKIPIIDPILRIALIII